MNITIAWSGLMPKQGNDDYILISLRSLFPLLSHFKLDIILSIIAAVITVTVFFSL